MKIELTKVHVNALLSLLILAGLDVGIIWALLHTSNGGTLPERILEMLVLILGASIYGVVAVAKQFSGIDEACPNCGFRDGDPKGGTKNV